MFYKHCLCTLLKLFYLYLQKKKMYIVLYIIVKGWVILINFSVRPRKCYNSNFMFSDKMSKYTTHKLTRSRNHFK